MPLRGEQAQEDVAPRVMEDRRSLRPIRTGPRVPELQLSAVGVSFTWLGVALLGIETPRLQQEVDGYRLCTSAYLNVCSHAAVVVVLPYLAALRCPAMRPTLERNIVFVGLCLMLTCIVTVAMLWRVWPPSILVTASVFGAVGAISSVVAVPWCTHHDHRTGRGAPAVLLGNKVGILAAAILGFVQQPGAARPVFGPAVYLSVFALPVCFSLGCFLWLERTALVPAAPAPAESSVAVVARDSAAEKEASLPPRSSRQLLRAAWPLMACLGWVNLHCWGVQPSILPFAALNTDPDGEGHETLQWLTLCGVISLNLGAAAPWFYRNRAVGGQALLFSALSVLPYVIAFDRSSFWRRPFGAPMLVGAVSCLRFVEAYQITMVFVIIGERFPTERAAVSRLAGVVDRLLVTLGSALSIALVGASGSAEARGCFVDLFQRQAGDESLVPPGTLPPSSPP